MRTVRSAGASRGASVTELSSSALRRRRIASLYTAPDDGVDNLCRTARLTGRTVGFPEARVHIMDSEYVYVVADSNRPAAAHGRDNSVPISRSVCQFTVGRARSLAVDDLAARAPYAALPAVRTGAVRSYLGVPLRSREAEVIGTLCVFDSVPRRITPAQVRHLLEFAGIVEDQLDLIRRTHEANARPSSSSAALARAIEAGEVVPWYQPVVELESGRTTSHEALARWVHPDGSIEDPARFVPLAEDSQLVLDLDLVIMRQALADLSRWQQQTADQGVNVNLSPLHLEIDGGVEAIRAVVEASGVDPARVTLEITEARRIVEIDRAAAAVRALRSDGHPVVLDDYGTGCSGLSWVVSLPVTGIKIDKSVTAVLDTPVGRAVTRAATGLARDLDLSLILEGVGTAAQVAGAREQGYRFGQGYYWSPPVPASTVEARARA